MTRTWAGAAPRQAHVVSLHAPARLAPIRTAPGRAEYLGGGLVRLDQEAISTLAGLADGEDFKVSYTGAGPVLTVGADRYLAREESPDPKGTGPGGTG